MGLIESASSNSLWRGIDYFECKKVISWNKSGDKTYEGVVGGSNNCTYSVHVDKEHPRKSTCTCPFAIGRRVVCKHMIALYFTAEPQAAQDFMQQVQIWEEQEQEREQMHYKELHKYVLSLSKSELQEQLYSALLELENRKNYW